jgi:hypothetical protein
MSHLERLTSRLLPEDPADTFRLQEFRAAHPDVIIGDGGFGTLQARIPAPNGETVITRHTLRELLDRLDRLDKLDELTAPDSGGLLDCAAP